MANDEPASLPPLVWAVWITGRGWLRDAGGHVFADMHREMAEAARRMYTGNLLQEPEARVELFDDAMLHLEPLFLEREAAAIKEHARLRRVYDNAVKKADRERQERRLVNRLRKLIHELLGHRNPI